MGLFLAAAGSAATYAADCPDIRVRVTSGSETDRGRFCIGAGRAVEFFRSHGLAIKRTIPVTLTDARIVNHGSHIGLYEAKTQTIEFLSFRQAVRQCQKQSPFGTPMDEALYTSFATHELAHAIADQHFQFQPNSPIAHEYIAYVAQISTMQPQKRLKILQNYDVSAFGDPEEMSLVYYGLDPSAFGIKAYLHFRALPDQRAFLNALLTGAIKPGTSP